MALRRQNWAVRIDVRNLQRQPLFRVEVDPRQLPSVVRPTGQTSPEVFLHWDQALDDQGHLRRCPVCGCREMFARKDFPQVTGFVIVVLAGLAAMVLFGYRQVPWAVGILAAVAGIDATVYLFTGRCLVCYRCRSEFRRLPIGRDQPAWDLAIGEKYRALPTPPGPTTMPEPPPSTPHAGDRP